MKVLKTTFIAILALFAFSACNSLMKTNSKQTSKTKLSLETSPSTGTNAVAASDSSSTSNSGLIIANSQDTLKIDTAKVMIREIEFHRTEKTEAINDSTKEEGDDHFYNDEDSTEFEQGPFVLNLNLDTTMTTIAINKLPNGTYNYLSFQIHRPLPNQTVTDSEFVGGPNNDQRFSIVVKGSYNGKHFVFKSPRSIHERIALNPALTISDSLKSYNATIQVDVSKWFIDRDGQILDPTNPNDAFAINWAIRRSFYAFKDNNDDGHADDDGWGWGFGHHSDQNHSKSDNKQGNNDH